MKSMGARIHISLSELVKRTATKKVLSLMMVRLLSKQITVASDGAATISISSVVLMDAVRCMS